MTKKATISWNAVSGADGYFIYFSKFSTGLAFEAAISSAFTVLHNLAATDVVNFGVQAFQLQTINGVERRVFGPISVVQIEVADGATHMFSDTTITGVTVETE